MPEVPEWGNDYMSVRSDGTLKEFLQDTKTKTGVYSVEVGVIDSATYINKHTRKERKEPVTVAAVAMYNELGTEHNGKEHIPARPAWRNAIDESKDDVKSLIEAGFKKSKSLHVSKDTAKLIGQIVRDAIKLKIKDLEDPENADSTKRQKESSNPLIDQGILRQAIVFRVNDDKSEEVEGEVIDADNS